MTPTHPPAPSGQAPHPVPRGDRRGMAPLSGQGAGGPAGVGGLLPTPQEAVDQSRPRPRFPLMPVMLVGGVAIMVGLLMGDAPSDAGKLAQRGLAYLIPLVLLGLAVAWGGYMSRQLRDEEEAVCQIEDAVRLRTYEPMIWTLAGLLSRPMLSPLARARALFAYVGAMVKFGRFEEAALAVDLMLDEGVPVGMVGSLRGARAYAMLREDRLFDADRALTDIKKMGRDGPMGALLALSEQYRDVRTGHADDVLEKHSARRTLVAGHISTRVADLDALAAWAALRLGQRELASALWRRATTVGQASELTERYPELSSVAGELSPTPLPAELVTAPAMSSLSLPGSPVPHMTGGWR